MDLKTFREARGLSQQALAELLELKSKGQISSIESGTWFATLRVALQVEQWSAGEVRAIDLVAPHDRRLLAAAIARGLPADCRVEAIEARLEPAA